VAGYSETSLLRKLGITDDATVALIGAPDGVIPLSATVAVRTTARGSADVVVAFFRQRSDLERKVQALGRMVFPAGALWVAWPKRSSGMPTDITDEVIRQVALPLGLVDNKVCAIDDTWSGLRVVWRKERRDQLPD
jgi:hypothetical protein